MKITDILNKDKIISELKGNGKEDIINEMIDLFNDDNRVNDITKVRNAVLEREKIMSTGVGKGFAIPHGKTNAVNDMIAAFGKTSHKIDFNSLDKQPVNLVFLLVGKEDAVGPHIKLLSRISRMMNKDEFREQLLQAQSPEEIFRIFEQEEQKYIELR